LYDFIAVIGLTFESFAYFKKNPKLCQIWLLVTSTLFVTVIGVQFLLIYCKPDFSKAFSIVTFCAQLYSFWVVHRFAEEDCYIRRKAKDYGFPCVEGWGGQNTIQQPLGCPEVNNISTIYTV
jgi:hypothetical protein